MEGTTNTSCRETCSTFVTILSTLIHSLVSTLCIKKTMCTHTSAIIFPQFSGMNIGFSLRSRIRFPYVPNYLFYIMVASWPKGRKWLHGPVGRERGISSKLRWQSKFIYISSCLGNFTCQKCICMEFTRKHNAQACFHVAKGPLAFHWASAATPYTQCTFLSFFLE